MFPVVNDSRAVNCISLDLVKEVPREKWATMRVRDIAHGCNQDNTLEIHSDAVKALTAMRRTGNSRFLVMDHGKLAGIITMKDLFEFLSMKIDLEEHK
jgi:Mg2+/Co2+ transporter CorC